MTAKYITYWEGKLQYRGKLIIKILKNARNCYRLHDKLF